MSAAQNSRLHRIVRAFSRATGSAVFLFSATVAVASAPTPPSDPTPESAPPVSPVPRDGFAAKLYFLVPPGAESARLVIAWDYAHARPLAFRLMTPEIERIAQGRFVPPNEADLRPNTIIDRTDLTTPLRRVVEIHRPAPGRWVVEMDEARPELGWLRLEELETPPLPSPPRVEWAQNYRPLTSTGRVDLAWRIHHLPPDAQIALSSGGEARPGGDLPGVRREGDLYLLSWDTTALKAGAYFLTAHARSPDGTPLARTLFPVIVKVKGRPRLELTLQTPATVRTGATIDVCALVENTGDGPSEPVEVSVRVPPELDARAVEPPDRFTDTDGDWRLLRISSIAPGVTRLARLAIEAPSAPGVVPLEIKLLTRGTADDLADSARAFFPREVRVVALSETATPAFPDLQVSRSPITGTRMLGERLAYTVTVKNAGPVVARAVRLLESANIAAYESVNPSQGAGKILLADNNRAEVLLGELPPGATATIAFTCTPYQASSLHTRSLALAAEPDASPLDNVTPDSLHDRIEPAPAP